MLGFQWYLHIFDGIMNITRVRTASITSRRISTAEKLEMAWSDIVFNFDYKLLRVKLTIKPELQIKPFH